MRFALGSWRDVSIAEIDNRQLRRALLSLNGLAPPAERDPVPRPAWTRSMVQRLGFVQVDAVSAVERAQHHILFCRNPRYRRQHLQRLLERDRTRFENWTHDAAILPIELYPYWKHTFGRMKRYEIHPNYRRYFAAVTPRDTERIVRRIRTEGPLRPRDFEGRKVRFRDDTFPAPSIAKLAMERLWRTGRLAIAHRKGTEKVYDLAQRVIPPEQFAAKVSKREYVDWACRGALARLGVAIDLKVDRKADRLDVLGLWWENHARPTRARIGRLERELGKLARFTEVSGLAFPARSA